MISWVEKEYKNNYKDSAKASGIRYKYYTYGEDFDKSTVEDIRKFISFLRKNYYFPIRLNILFCNTRAFCHHIDNHTYYGAFYNMDDEKRKVYPRISIAARVAKNNSLEEIFFTLAHEITHYYQWYFLEDKKRTNRSLEIEANKWANYILGLYFN
ncbi:MAG: hypothetical protein IJC87_00060 [Clostridia bacterium]|nr:hypothetical protein [Clostridia bacterium]